VAESTPEDVELALDAAHAAKDAWGESSATERAEVLNAVADAIEQNKEMLAVTESWENGKPVRETLNADIPLVVDHFRYFAAAARAEEGTSTGDRQGPGRLPLPRAPRVSSVRSSRSTSP
jgi:aldehyde dehydrogenase